MTTTITVTATKNPALERGVDDLVIKVSKRGRRRRRRRRRHPDITDLSRRTTRLATTPSARNTTCPVTAAPSHPHRSSSTMQGRTPRSATARSAIRRIYLVCLRSTCSRIAAIFRRTATPVDAIAARNLPQNPLPAYTIIVVVVGGHPILTHRRPPAMTTRKPFRCDNRTRV